MSATAGIAVPRRLTVAPELKRRRALIDRGFRLAGFLATFFGLGMLVVFLCQLAVETVSWFNTMPALVEERNQEARYKVQEAEQILKDELARLEREKQDLLSTAASAEDKKEIDTVYREEIIPRRTAEFKQRTKEYEINLQHLRSDTSPPALVGSFLTEPPSYQPESAGIRTALLGSIFLVVITALFAVPLGVGAAIYLEEYSSRNWLARIIQLNITNLAGVPSVVFGILGAALFVDLVFRPIETRQYELAGGYEASNHLLGWLFDQLCLNLPTVAARNVLGGGMTLALLTLPIVIVASQEAIRAVPQSIRHGAYALGATHWQVTWTVVLPNSIPGILTGTILSMSRAIGEAAPLVLFGALLYVNQDPSLFSRFTGMPMQIFDWAGRVEPAWRYNAAVASVILLVTLLLMNGLAIYLRQRGQRHMKW